MVRVAVHEQAIPFSWLFDRENALVNKERLSQRFMLNRPAAPEQIESVQSMIDVRLPKTYKDFLLTCNGLRSSGGLVLHEIEALPARNADYEIGKHLRGYFMIGDDGGGQAILINQSGALYEISLALRDTRFVEKSAQSLEDLLIHHQGMTLGERWLAAAT